ncbi:MAG TPA: hypothetical protein VFL82_00975 [Thermomicrobiales bacterium]|nr:hypothetical protein [Thermomicrobiales bacterium]
MILNREFETDSRMRSAIEELQMLIRQDSPEAVFTVGTGEDPDGVYLRAVVDVEDRGEVIDVVIDRLVSLQVEDGLPIYITIARPPARNAAIIRQLSERTPRAAAAISS